MYVNKTKTTHALYVYVVSETTLLLEIQTKKYIFPESYPESMSFFSDQSRQKKNFQQFLFSCSSEKLV